MIQPQTYLTIADNTGAKKLMCIRVLGNNWYNEVIPAVAPAAPEIAHPTVRIKSTRIPASREISGAKDDARSDKPRLVRWKIKVSEIINKRTIPRISNRIGDKAILSPETTNPLSGSGGGSAPIRSP